MRREKENRCYDQRGLLFVSFFRSIFKEESLSRDGFSWKYGRSLTNELHFRFFNALIVINTADWQFYEYEEI